MARHRTLHRADTTAKALIAAACQLGALYLPLDSAVDGLLLFRGRAYIIDWKSPGASLTATQKKLVTCGWPIYFLETEDQVRKLLLP